MKASPSKQLTQRLEAAIAARAGLLADPRTTVCRVFNSSADGIAGLVIEKLGETLIAQLHEGRLTHGPDDVHALCTLAAERLNAIAVYRKVYPKDRAGGGAELERLHNAPTPWIGRPVGAELPVLEAGLTYLVHPHDGYSTGLFLDQRANRGRLRELAAGRRVLNTFAYTCGFTVAAASGGATTTVSVDIAKRVLEWGKRNLTANDIPLDSHRFICSDVRAYYSRARRQGHRFDLIILDPPTFARLKKPRGVFVLTEELDALVAGALELLAPGGLILLSVNHREFRTSRLEQAILEGARNARRRGTVVERPALPADFAGDPDHMKSVLARVD